MPHPFPLPPLTDLAGEPLSRRRLALLGGGGLLLVLLIAAQGALEQATAPAARPPATPAPGADAALPDYSVFAAAPAEPPWWLVLGGLALKLGLVLLLIYATIWLLRRYLGRPAGAAAATGALRLLQSLPLGQQQYVHLIEVGDRLLVVGATPQHLTLLGEIDDSATAGELRLQAGRRPGAPPRPFTEHLAAADPPVPGAAPPGAGRATPPPPADRPRRPAAPRATPPAGAPAAAATPAPAADRASALPPHAAGRGQPPRPAEIEAAFRDGRAALAQHLSTLRAERRNA
jgi:flagellar biosynthetic protein FliO